MFAYFRGQIIERNFSNTSFVLDVNNIGYQIFSNTKTLAELKTGHEIIIYTHARSNDDGIKLWGFITKAEKELFEMLLTVSGVGPKSAANILNLLKVEEIISAVLREDDKMISEAQGIGPKTAKRIILELKNKLKSINKFEGIGSMAEGEAQYNNEDIYGILNNLGFSSVDIQRKLIQAKKENIPEDTELLVKFCLRG